jgi:hypothetical protein
VKLREVITVSLEMAGLAAVCGAGFVLWLWLGLLLTGASLWIVSWMVASGEPPERA